MVNLATITISRSKILVNHRSSIKPRKQLSTSPSVAVTKKISRRELGIEKKRRWALREGGIRTQPRRAGEMNQKDVKCSEGRKSETRTGRLCRPEQQLVESPANDCGAKTVHLPPTVCCHCVANRWKVKRDASERHYEQTVRFSPSLGVCLSYFFFKTQDHQ